MKIIVSGLTASGKTYHARKLADYYGLEYLSGSEFLVREAGYIPDHDFWPSKQGIEFTAKRKIDSSIDMKADKKLLGLAKSRDSILLDSWVLPWIYTKKDSLMIYFFADLSTRVELSYLSFEGNREKEDLKEIIINKDKDTVEIFKNLHSVDISKTKGVFDIIFDMSGAHKINPEETTTRLIKTIEDYKKNIV